MCRTDTSETLQKHYVQNRHAETLQKHYVQNRHAETLQKHYVQNRHVRNSTEALNSLLGQTSHEAHLSAHNSHCPRLHHLRRRRRSNPPEDRWRWWWWWRGVLPTIFFLNEWSSDLCSSSSTLNIQQTNTLWPVTILIIISIKTLTGCLDLRNC